MALQYEEDGRIVPIVHSDLSLGERCDVAIPGLARIRWEVEGAELVLLDEADLRVDGQAAAVGTRVVVGQTIEWGGCRLKLIPLTIGATLQGCNEPYHDRIWPVGYQPVIHIGRLGRRTNEVELNDKTISRTQARLEVVSEGTQLVAESATFVNSESLEVGESRILQDRDLVRFGNFVFRYQVGSPHATEPEPGIKLFCLGGFQVEAAGVAGTGADWRSHTARFLLAYLASEWPRPVALEPLLETFWPELDEERARGNFRVTLHKIRKSLPLPETAPPIFERTTYTLSFHPELNFWHDVHEFQRCIDSKNWKKALDLYRGKYLEECYMDWAEAIRARLESSCLEAGLQLLKATADPAERLEVARRCLQLDPCCQPAILAAMETSRLLGRPEESLKLFESFRKVLEQTLGMEPALDILREVQLARLHVS